MTCSRITKTFGGDGKMKRSRRTFWWPHFSLYKHISLWHTHVNRERGGRRGRGERATDLVYPQKHCRFCLREFSASDRYLLSAFKCTIITFRLRLMWRTQSIFGIKDTSPHLRAVIFRWHCFLRAIYGTCSKLVSFLSRHFCNTVFTEVLFNWSLSIS